MNEGHIAEYGPPSQLLQMRQGIFRAMVDTLGEEAAAEIERAADAAAADREEYAEEKPPVVGSLVLV